MIGLGCMRLSTEPARDEARAAAVLSAALAGGVQLLDTSDAYCHDDSEVGHNERLVGAAIATVTTPVFIVSKGGLERPGGAWVPNGRGKHLAAAARASRDRLGVEAIDLYLLHAIDPKTPLATSVRALARLRDEGIVRQIGLSNVTPTQLDAALAITRIDAVEIELNPWKLDALRGGLLMRCTERGIRVLAHRPLGGPNGVKRALRDKRLREIAARTPIAPQATAPTEIVLAWLRSLSPMITVIPGATRLETVAGAIRGQQLELDDDAKRALASHFIDVTGTQPAASTTRPSTVYASPRDPRDLREIVLVVGMPGAGKSTVAADYVARGYGRLNRDDRGGSLLALARALDEELARPANEAGSRDEAGGSFVIDNTYPTRASRAPILEVARRHGVPVRCVVVATPIEQAQAFAAQRMLERHGGFDAPGSKDEIRPNTQFRYRRDFEPPAEDEGYISIEEIVPVRRATGTRRALIVELDGVIWLGKPIRPDKIELRPGVLEGLRPWLELSGLEPGAERATERRADPIIAATVWRPGATREQIAALAARLGELLGRTIDVRACPHAAGPPVCWCRKPMPGLALALARDHDLDLARSIHVGTGPADRGFASRAGMQYATINEERRWPRP